MCGVFKVKNDTQSKFCKIKYMVYLNFFIITVDFVQKCWMDFTAVQWKQLSRLSFWQWMLESTFIIILFFCKSSLFDSFYHMFSLLSMIKEEQRKFHRRYEKYTFVLKKKFFHLYFRNCSLQRSSFRPYKGNWYRPRCFLLNVEFAKNHNLINPACLGTGI